MKNLLKIISGLIVSGMVSCTSARYASNQYDDDVYYTPSDDLYSQSSTGSSDEPSPEDRTSSSENSSDQYNAEQYSADQPDNSGRNITNNYYGDYYDSDDYYDYAYSSRIRRFYNPIYSFGYYDPWYTNAYWYNYNPVYYGSSIYLGYSWWYPGWNIGWNSYYGWNFGWNSGWGYPYSGCGYYAMSYYNPYGYGNSYWHGYNNGYWNGYHNGYNDGLYASNYYYNSYDANSYYYGHRSSTSSNGNRYSRSLAENYQNSVGSEKAFNSRFSDTPKTSGNRTEPAGISNVSQGTKDGTRMQPAKESSTVSPDRGKVNDINSYSTPKGLNQKGGNDYSSPKGNSVKENANVIENEVKPGRESNFGTIKSHESKPDNEYVQPNRSKPGFGNVKKSNEYSIPEKYSQPKENNRGNDFEPQKNPGKSGWDRPKENNNYESPKKHNNSRENSLNNPGRSSSPSSPGRENSGKMSIPNTGSNSSGGSIGGGSRGSSGGSKGNGNFSPAPSGGGNHRRGK